MRAGLRRLAAVPMVVGALAACGEDDSGSAEGSASSVAEAPVIDDPIVATPSTAAPGALVDLTFPTELPRGAPWYLSKWDGDAWSEPLYLLTASTEGYRPVGGPSWRPRSEEWGWDDIGVLGPGPDTIVVPDTAERGAYRLCTANAPVQTCVNIEVSAAE